MGGGQVAAHGKRERIHGGLENCYISLKEIEGREGGEATQEEKDVHHRRWGRLGKSWARPVQRGKVLAPPGLSFRL